MVQAKRKGLLTPIRFIERRGKLYFWLYRCDCGTEKIMWAAGKAKSCGCSRKGNGKTHGMWGTRVYRIWAAILQRTTNPKSSSYFKYGERGITIDPRWKHFEKFFEDMGEPPTNTHSIERINNDGPYKKDNCRWATVSEQSRNTRKNVFMVFNGHNRVLKDWATEFHLPYRTVSGRHKRGWTPEQVLGLTARPLDRTLTLNGKTLLIKEWSQLTGLKAQTINARLRSGCSVENALRPVAT